MSYKSMMTEINHLKHRQQVVWIYVHKQVNRVGVYHPSLLIQRLMEFEIWLDSDRPSLFIHLTKSRDPIPALNKSDTYILKGSTKYHFVGARLHKKRYKSDRLLPICVKSGRNKAVNRWNKVCDKHEPRPSVTSWEMSIFARGLALAMLRNCLRDFPNPNKVLQPLHSMKICIFVKIQCCNFTLFG